MVISVRTTRAAVAASTTAGALLIIRSALAAGRNEACPENTTKSRRRPRDVRRARAPGAPVAREQGAGRVEEAVITYDDSGRPMSVAKW